uniref:Uncharacterized protein n=1 Tax=Desulfobacca acetoxidans TaxID=60893 RepID=A0A7V6A0Z4_9BACT
MRVKIASTPSNNDVYDMIFRLSFFFVFFWTWNRRNLLLGVLPESLALTILIRNFFAHNALIGRSNR